MNKNIIVLAFFLLISGVSMAQGIGINEDSSTPDPSAILDVSSTSKGLLIPRMTSTERQNISSAATGLMVYDSEFESLFFYDGSSWQPLAATVSGTGPAHIPSSPYPGQMYFDLTAEKLYVYVSSGWAEVSLGTPSSVIYFE